MTETAMPVFDGHNDLLLRLWLHDSVVVASLDATDRAALALVRKVRNPVIGSPNLAVLTANDGFRGCAAA